MEEGREKKGIGEDIRNGMDDSARFGWMQRAASYLLSDMTRRSSVEDSGE